MRVDLLCHGETVDQAFLCGSRCDAHLSARGMGQMRKRLIRRRYDAIFTSPAQRCRAFAEDWADTHNLTVEVMDALRERDWGAWDGLPLETVQQRWPLELEAYLADPFGVTPPEAEPFADYRARVTQAFERLLRCGSQQVLAVTHAGVIKLCAQQVLGFDDAHLFHFGVEPASLIGFAAVGSFTRLEQLEND